MVFTHNNNETTVPGLIWQFQLLATGGRCWTVCAGPASHLVDHVTAMMWYMRHTLYIICLFWTKAYESRTWNK